MLRFLFALFILVPLLELWLLIEVGSGIGGLSTIALCLLTAALGGFLIRYQGVSTLIDAQKRMAHGEAPVDHGFHGVMIALAGVLLFTPGFITDSIGFLLLVPQLRQLLINKALPAVQIPGSPNGPGQSRPHDPLVIEAEIVSEEKHHRP
ncbi:exlusion protein FxsA [Mariprofundus sp. NF]|uniref:FxsA family protein n=1 Tax=Mariprofundus sp. NF TaxID=2608716 RepID=UPI0015A0F6E1|nr:FxsA family protein [Mariprofundus sp. NF]NWF39415.1 exlusion protein FxsA [Mariprofundus sp. NF]